MTALRRALRVDSASVAPYSSRQQRRPILFNLFRKKPAEPPPSTGGRLAYAIGDVHGRLDVLLPLLRDIVNDAASAAPEDRPLLVLLGDYVDRGPQSKGVVDLILKMLTVAHIETRALKGNHEEALLKFLDDPSFGPTWMEHGGAATMASYGVQPPASRLSTDAWTTARDQFAAALPADHLAFYQGLELMLRAGDYAFVHAGVRPGVPLEHQAERDLLWIRHEFLQAPGPFGAVIVHGHTPAEEPQLTRHRLGIDTGAYATGVLTAVRLFNEEQRVMCSKVERPLAAAPV